MDSDIPRLWRTFRREPSSETFTPFYEATQKLVFTLCFRILGSQDDAEDALQAAYGRILSEAGRLDEASGEEFVGMVCRLAVREAENLRKRRARRATREVVMDALPERAAPGSSPKEETARRELRAKLEAAVATLPDRLRVPVQLHYFHGMTHEQIGRALGVSRVTVTDRIGRAVRKLERVMRRMGIGRAEVSLGAVVGAAVLLSAPGRIEAATLYTNLTAGLGASAGASAEAGSVLHSVLSRLIPGGRVGGGSGATGPSHLVSWLGGLGLAAALLVTGYVVLRPKGPARVNGPVSSAASVPFSTQSDSASSGAAAAPAAALSPTPVAEDDLFAGMEPSTPILASLEGTVMDEFDLAGALVKYFEPLSFGFGDPVAESRTDASGQYYFEDLLAQSGYVKVQAEGFQCEIANVDLRGFGDSILAVPRGLAEEIPSRKDIRLQPDPHALAGRVLDAATGDPVAGARLAYVLPTYYIPLSTTADEAGEFRLEGLPAGEGLLTVAAPGYHLRILRGVQPGAEPLMVPLSSGGKRIEGRVREVPSGSPIDQAHVLVYPRGGRNPLVMGQTDPAGEFQTPGLPLGRYELEVRKGFLVRNGEGRLPVDLLETSPDATEVELTLGTTRTVKGQVVDAVTGEPIAGALVRNFVHGGWHDRGDGALAAAPCALTDERGRFLLPEVGCGDAGRHFQETYKGREVILSSEAFGYYFSNQMVEFPVDGNDPEPATLRLSPALVFQGEVKFADGAPAEGARISVWDEGEDRGRFSFRTGPGGTGECNLPLDLRGGGLNVKVTGPQGQQIVDSLTWPTEKPVVARSYVLDSRTTQDVAVTVVDANDQPVPGVIVGLSVESDEEGYGSGERMRTDADGIALFHNVPRSILSVSVKRHVSEQSSLVWDRRIRDLRESTEPLETIVVLLDDRASALTARTTIKDLGSLDSKEEQPGVRIVGRILDPSGAPYAGPVRIQVLRRFWDEKRNRWDGTEQGAIVGDAWNLSTADSGVFRFTYSHPALDSFRESQFALRAVADGAGFGRSDWIVGTEPRQEEFGSFVIPLREWKEISGRVLDKETGDPIEGAWVVALSPTLDDASLHYSVQFFKLFGIPYGVSDSTGAYQVAPLESNKHPLRVYHPDYGTREFSLPSTENADQVLTMDLPLEPMVRWHARVEGLTGLVSTGQWGLNLRPAGNNTAGKSGAHADNRSDPDRKDDYTTQLQWGGFPPGSYRLDLEWYPHWDLSAVASLPKSFTEAKVYTDPLILPEGAPVTIVTTVERPGKCRLRPVDGISPVVELEFLHRSAPIQPQEYKIRLPVGRYVLEPVDKEAAFTPHPVTITPTGPNRFQFPPR